MLIPKKNNNQSNKSHIYRFGDFKLIVICSTHHSKIYVSDKLFEQINY